MLCNPVHANDSMFAIPVDSELGQFGTDHGLPAIGQYVPGLGTIEQPHVVAHTPEILHE